MRLFAIILCLSVMACASDKKEELLVDDAKPPEELYNKAQDSFDEANYKTAAKEFLDVERQHPYSALAQKAQVQAAYAYYKDEKYDDAISTLQRFAKLNPGNEQTPYAYYLIALSYYNQISTVERDQQKTIEAQQALKDVISRYPNSDYALDAKYKLDLVEDHLAGKEMTVGRYYQKKQQYIGAINRFKKVVEEYPTTAQVEEALHRLVECYLALGITPEAQKYAAVLGHNYPGSEWYQNSYDLLTSGEIKEPQPKKESWYKVW